MCVRGVMTNEVMFYQFRAFGHISVVSSDSVLFRLCVAFA